MFEITVIGHLGKDAEVRSSNGKTYTYFTVCSSRKYKKVVNGSEIDATDTTWISCMMNGGEKLANYLKKGTQVFVRGNGKVGTYRAQNNEIYADVSLSVRDIQLLSSKTESQTPEQAPAADNDRF